MAIGYDEDWYRTGENIRRMREEMESERRQEQERLVQELEFERMKMLHEMEKRRYQTQPDFDMFSPEDIEKLKRMILEQNDEPKKEVKEHFDEEDFTI